MTTPIIIRPSSFFAVREGYIRISGSLREEVRLTADAITALIGSSGSGKTTFLRKLLEESGAVQLSLLESLQGQGEIVPPSGECTGLPPLEHFEYPSRSLPLLTWLGGSSLLARELEARGQFNCPRCHGEVRNFKSRDALSYLLNGSVGALIAICVEVKSDVDSREGGFSKQIVSGRVVDVEEGSIRDVVEIVIDRIRVAPERSERLMEALLRANALQRNGVRIYRLSEVDDTEAALLFVYGAGRQCVACGIEYPNPEPDRIAPRWRSLPDISSLQSAIGEHAALVPEEIKNLFLDGVLLDQLLGSSIADLFKALASPRLRAFGECLSSVGVGDYPALTPCALLSLGDRERFRLAIFAFHARRGTLVLLDAPFDGVHPEDEGGVRRAIEGIHSRGCGVVYSTSGRGLVPTDPVIPLDGAESLHGGSLARDPGLRGELIIDGISIALSEVTILSSRKMCGARARFFGAIVPELKKLREVGAHGIRRVVVSSCLEPRVTAEMSLGEYLGIFREASRFYAKLPEAIVKGVDAYELLRSPDAARSLVYKGISYFELCTLSIADARGALGNIPAMRGLFSLSASLGLGALRLDRTLDTLSAGETRRATLVRDIQHLGEGLVVALESPCTGLSPEGAQKLLTTLSQWNVTTIILENIEYISLPRCHFLEISSASPN